MSTPSLEIAEADLNDGQQTLEITWRDGHRSVYPLPYLRAECPCATCRTERDAARSNPFHVISKPPVPVIVGIEPVGRYGMRIAWQDGHDAGIYTFEYLREICPCDACKAARTGQNTPFVHGIYIPPS